MIGIICRPAVPPRRRAKNIAERLSLGYASTLLHNRRAFISRSSAGDRPAPFATTTHYCSTVRLTRPKISGSLFSPACPDTSGPPARGYYYSAKWLRYVARVIPFIIKKSLNPAQFISSVFSFPFPGPATQPQAQEVPW